MCVSLWEFGGGGLRVHKVNHPLWGLICCVYFSLRESVLRAGACHEALSSGGEQSSVLLSHHDSSGDYGSTVASWGGERDCCEGGLENWQQAGRSSTRRRTSSMTPESAPDSSECSSVTSEFEQYCIDVLQRL